MTRKRSVVSGDRYGEIDLRIVPSVDVPGPSIWSWLVFLDEVVEHFSLESGEERGCPCVQVNAHRVRRQIAFERTHPAEQHRGQFFTRRFDLTSSRPTARDCSAVPRSPADPSRAAPP